MKNWNKKNENCVLFFTHRIQDLPDYIKYVKNCVPGNMDFGVIYDIHSRNVVLPDDYNIYTFDSAEIKGFFINNDRRLPTILKPMFNFTKEVHYSHYLVMEDDIVFTGNLREFFEKINSVDCDYIHIASDLLGGLEEHWPIELIKDNPFKHLYFAWSQLFYASDSFIQGAESFVKENDTFNMEFLLPSLAYNNGYSVRQFENFGYNFDLSWGPAEVFEDRYKREYRNKTFYHPIKDTNFLFRYRNHPQFSMFIKE